MKTGSKANQKIKTRRRPEEELKEENKENSDTIGISIEKTHTTGARFHSQAWPGLIGEASKKKELAQGDRRGQRAKAR
jgi:hypothetical protein